MSRNSFTDTESTFLPFLFTFMDMIQLNFKKSRITILQMEEKEGNSINLAAHACCWCCKAFILLV